MVMRVCRGVLRDVHDAEDAFQATFLILARKAGSIRGRESLASWLHSVAHNVAATARSDAARRPRHELAAGGTRPQTLAEEVWDDFGPVVHEELDRLSGRYRAAVVLCYLEGLTQQQAAEQLGWPLGTVQSRLARGRQRLRVRLMRRGLTPAVWLTGAVLTTAPAPPAVAAALVDSTTRAATRFAAGKKAAEIVSASIATLTEGVLGTMLMTKLGKLAAIALLAGFTAGGVGVLAAARGQSDAQAPPPTADATVSPRPKPDDTKTEADALRRRQAELIAEVQSLKDELAKAKAAQGQPIFDMRARGGGGMRMGGPGMGMGGGGGMRIGGPPGNPESTIPSIESKGIIAVPSSGEIRSGPRVSRAEPGSCTGCRRV